MAVTPTDIRRRLVEISDALRGLADGDFAAKHTLNVEADRLREELREQTGERADAQNDQWAHRASRRGDQDVAEQERRAAAILTTRGLTSEGQSS